MALRQTIRSLTPLLLRSSNVITPLPSSALSHQSRAGLAYGRRSGQLPTDDVEKDDASGEEYPSPGDTKDLAPSTYEGPDAQKPAGVSSGVSARPRPNTKSSRPDDLTPPEGEATAPDFEKNLEKDPHKADIPEFAGLNVKNQEEKEQKDPRLPEAGGGGITNTEKPPGNSPDMTGRAAGFSQDAQAPANKSASEEDSARGPAQEENPYDQEDPDIPFDGDKPGGDIPHSRYNSR
ncbi:g7664 [Coccomyxa viridis]|uniref:G7664 protein n=1 Tax=Coccomyxa viridis TaxID=1274662 RepID=A0ABP1G2Y3_9CHLO